MEGENNDLKNKVKVCEEKNKELEEKIKQLELQKKSNIISIIFYDEKDGKEYSVEINNEEIFFEELEKKLYEKYPSLKSERKKKFTIEGENIDMISETEYNANTRINFW